MTPQRFYDLRKQFGLGHVEMGVLCGLTGTNRNIKDRVIEWEKGQRDLPRATGRMLALIEACKVLPVFPEDEDERISTWERFRTWEAADG